MKEIAYFAKVSDRQFAKDFYHLEDGATIDSVIKTPAFTNIYSSIILPARATTGSAGYDFYLPDDLAVAPGKPVVVPTGIRIFIDPGWMLMLFPRSGLGFRYGMRLRNTTGIIDSDYFHADNEGHIAAKIVVDEPLVLKAGDRFMQGVLVPHGIASNDFILMKQRTGGFGSTGKK